jgi:hypothetical protein
MCKTSNEASGEKDCKLRHKQVRSPEVVAQHERHPQANQRGENEADTVPRVCSSNSG